MPISLLWSLIPSAISLGSQLLNKPDRPRREDFVPDTGFLDKYIASLKGRRAERGTFQTAIQPAIRRIAGQGRQAQRRISESISRAGLKGGGIEAGQKLRATQITTQALQSAGERATALQLQESRRIGEKIDVATLRQEEAIETGERAFSRAERQFRSQERQRRSQIGGAVAGLAAAGIGQYIQGLSAAKQTMTTAFEGAKAVGILPEGIETVEDFSQASKEAGFTQPAQFGKSLAVQAQTLDKEVGKAEKIAMLVSERRAETEATIQSTLDKQIKDMEKTSMLISKRRDDPRVEAFKTDITARKKLVANKKTHGTGLFSKFTPENERELKSLNTKLGIKEPPIAPGGFTGEAETFMVGEEEITIPSLFDEDEEFDFLDQIMNRIRRQ